MYFLFFLSGRKFFSSASLDMSRNILHKSNQESAARRIPWRSIRYEDHLHFFGKISNEPTAKIVETKNDDCWTIVGRLVRKFEAERTKMREKWKGIP